MLFRNIKPVAPKSTGTYRRKRRSTVTNSSLCGEASCGKRREGASDHRASVCSALVYHTSVILGLRKLPWLRLGDSFHRLPKSCDCCRAAEPNHTAKHQCRNREY